MGPFAKHKSSLSQVFLFQPALPALHALTLRLLAAGMAKGQDELKVYVCKDFSIWLCNCSDQDMEVGPQELFGFNTGVYKDALGGRALAWTHDVPKPRLLAKLMFSLFL